MGDEDIKIYFRFEADFGEGYTCTTKSYKYMGEKGILFIDGKIKHKSSIVGSMSGYYVKRDSRLNFHDTCDIVSEELNLIALDLFRKSGKLRKVVWQNELEPEVLEACGFGGFLNIEVLKVEKDHRKKDLGFKYLQHLLNSMVEDWSWSISVIVPEVE